MNPLLCRLCLSRWGNPSINPWTHIHTSRFMPSPKRLVSFTHALFEGLKWDLTFSSAQNLKDLSPSVWNMQNIACLWHFFQIACSLPWLMLWKLQPAKYNYECLYVHVYRYVCSGVFLYVYLYKFQIPFMPAFPASLATLFKASGPKKRIAAPRILARLAARSFSKNFYIFMCFNRFLPVKDAVSVSFQNTASISLGRRPPTVRRCQGQKVV